jgi:predicted amidohydrolase YtcJ
VHKDNHGVLVPGASATFAVWETGALANGLPTLDPADVLPRCRRTVLRGTTIYEAT